MIPITNCQVDFSFKCPKEWEELQPTTSLNTRFCNVCSKNVYYCSTIEQVRANALLQNCIAVGTVEEYQESSQKLKRRMMRPTLGVPLNHDDIRTIKKFKKKPSIWERIRFFK
jgi:hypothetical protein